MVQTRIQTFPDIAEQIDFFAELPDYNPDMYTHKKSKSTAESSLQVLKETLPLLEASEGFDNDTLFTVLKAYADEKGLKVNTVMWPLRTAVSGKAATPAGATGIMEVLGKNETIRRIRDGIARLDAAE